MFTGTTILCVRNETGVAMAGDGQVTMGNQIIKASARKVRSLQEHSVLAGFAGSTADAMTLLERFEAKLEEYGGNLMKASVTMVREWRTDKALRRLEAMMLVADRNQTLLLSGAGDVLEPEEQATAIGSGAGFALAAAKAFLEGGSVQEARSIAERSMMIASEICIYTNANLTVEVIPA